MGWHDETIHFNGKETAVKMRTENGIVTKIETNIEIGLGDIFEMSGKQYKVLGKQPRRSGCTYFIEKIEGKENASD